VNKGRWLARSATHWRDIMAFGTDTGIVAEAAGCLDDGETLEREAVSMPIRDGSRRLTLAQVGAQMRAGEIDIGRDAQIVLQVSRDNGRLWGDMRLRSMGRRGEEVTTEWRGLGSSEKGFRLRLRVTDPVAPAVLGVEYEVG
jgi:hypothetical protein